MPRLARLDIAGLLQHVIVRGIERRDILMTIATVNSLLQDSFPFSPKPASAAMHGHFCQIISIYY